MMALRHRESIQKVLISDDALSRAATRSETQRFSSTGFKQAPGRIKSYNIEIIGTEQKVQGGFKELTLQLLTR
jgi:hypothetical protein